MTDSFCYLLNASVAEAQQRQRVRFDIAAGDFALNWLHKKHDGGAVHEPAMLAAFLAISRRYNCEVIFDVGALYGYFTLAAKDIFPDAEVAAFDMHPHAMRPLSLNIYPSPCFNVAVSDRIQENVKVWISGMNIYEEPDGGWDRLAVQPGAMKERGEGNRGRGFHNVDFLTLDYICENCFSESVLPDLIKIDVEGYQAKAIAGAMGTVRKHRPVIVVELHDPEKVSRLGTTNKETVRPLFEEGYRGYWCGNFRAKDATFEMVPTIDAMNEGHERLSLMVLRP